MFWAFPRCAGAGSRGTKPWRHPTASPPRGPSAGHRRPSQPFGLRSLTRDAGNRHSSARGWRLTQMHNLHLSFFCNSSKLSFYAKNCAKVLISRKLIKMDYRHMVIHNSRNPCEIWQSNINMKPQKLKLIMRNR